MMKWIVIGAVIIGVAGVTIVPWLLRGPDASQSADLANPRLSHLDDQRMLVVEAVRDPNLVAARAFKLLFCGVLTVKLRLKPTRDTCAPSNRVWLNLPAVAPM